LLYHLPAALGFIAGGRDAVPGRPALLPGLPLLATTTHHHCNSFQHFFQQQIYYTVTKNTS